MHDRLQANAHPIQLPIGAEDEFVGYYRPYRNESYLST